MVHSTVCSPGVHASPTPAPTSRGETGTFFRGAGREAHTGEVSISSSRRATAGVRFSIGRRLGPLFGLNAVWTFGARAVGAAGDCARPARPAPSAPGLSVQHGYRTDETCAGARPVDTIPAWRASAERPVSSAGAEGRFTLPRVNVARSYHCPLAQDRRPSYWPVIKVAAFARPRMPLAPAQLLTKMQKNKGGGDRRSDHPSSGTTGES